MYLTAGKVAISWGLYSFNDHYSIIPSETIVYSRGVVTTTHDMHDMHDSTWRVPGPRRPGIFRLRVDYCGTLKIPDMKTPILGHFYPDAFWLIFFIRKPVRGSKHANFHPEQGIQSAKKMLICEPKTIKIQKKINVHDRKINLQCISDAFRPEDKKGGILRPCSRVSGAWMMPI